MPYQFLKSSIKPSITLSVCEKSVSPPQGNDFSIRYEYALNLLSNGSL